MHGHCLVTVPFTINETSKMAYTAARLKAEIIQVVIVTVQELCESRGGRPLLSVLTSLLVSMMMK